MNSGVKVRLNIVESKPEIYGQYQATVNEFPKSVNHQYKKTKTGHLYLDKSVKIFRERFLWEARSLLKVPKNSALKVVLYFHSPSWVTKKHTIRTKDLDNLIKGTLDAMDAMGIPDENIFEIEAKKIVTAKKELIQIGIIDCGDIVYYHLG